MQILRDLVEEPLESALTDIGITQDFWRKALGPSREKSQGDISLPCFAFAKQLAMNPNDIAANLADKIKGNFSVEATGGYLNFKADADWLATQVMSGVVQAKTRDVLIEHTSANPNGPFHVGRARNAILGDTLVRLNRLYGNNVKAEYYVDDMGKQVGVLAWALDNLTENQVDEILDDSEAVNPKWSDK